VDVEDVAVDMVDSVCVWDDVVANLDEAECFLTGDVVVEADGVDVY
jgi:hypothetical protein